MIPEVDVDLFAGAGGWEEGAEALGIRPLGIELDAAACATRAARGFSTLKADVAALDLRELEPFRVRGVIASPPCQPFSNAGKGEGRKAIETYLEAISRWVIEAKPPTAAELDEACGDPRAHLTLEPLRWAIAAGPSWIALEQVPAVLPIWEGIAAALRRLGYGTWTGILSAERYGVPQTRKRAVLMAKWGTDSIVEPPPATHQRYIAPRKGDQGATLFEADSGRAVHPDDHGLHPWVSMAEALEWGMTDRPYPVIASSRTTGGPDKEKVGGSAARALLYAELASGRWEMGDVRSSNGCVRRVGEHSPTLTSSMDNGNFRWRYGDDPDKPTIRVSLEEAAVLQSFPADFPWQGTATQKFMQIGNAVPPLLARAVLAQLVRADV